MNKKGKLELTWVGKHERVQLEPRVLVEDQEKSYGNQKNENMLIFGDNLLALKALEQEYAGKVKCVFIDPPYNTGSAFEHYDIAFGGKPSICEIDLLPDFRPPLIEDSQLPNIPIKVKYEFLPFDLAINRFL